MKISIIIPTRERAQYLYYALQTALEIKDENIEIIVSDNFSDDNTKEIVNSFSDNRIKYTNTGQRVSMRENFNHGLLTSIGEYVIYFGDDDGILPNQFKFLRNILETHRPDGVSWSRITYGWPVEGGHRKQGGMRFFRNGTFGQPFSYDPHEENFDALMSGRVSNLLPVTPNIYHGCASRQYLNDLATAKDVYFNSVIPDVNFEYRSIIAGGQFIHSPHPFTISGSTPGSNGGGHRGYDVKDARGNPAKKFEEENKKDPYLDVFENVRFVPLAFFATIETIRTRMKSSTFKLDMTGWYRYVISSVRKNPDIEQLVMDVLQKHAEKTAATMQLDEAKNSSPIPRLTFREKMARKKDILFSFRRSTSEGGQNTILTAVHVYDDILGEDYGAVIQNVDTQKTAWKKAVVRSKKYKRQI